MSIWTQKDYEGNSEILLKWGYLYKRGHTYDEFSWDGESVHEKNVPEYGWGLIAPATLSRWRS